MVVSDVHFDAWDDVIKYNGQCHIRSLGIGAGEDDHSEFYGSLRESQKSSHHIASLSSAQWCWEPQRVIELRGGHHEAAAEVEIRRDIWC